MLILFTFCSPTNCNPSLLKESVFTLLSMFLSFNKVSNALLDIDFLGLAFNVSAFIRMTASNCFLGKFVFKTSGDIKYLLWAISFNSFTLSNETPASSIFPKVIPSITVFNTSLANDSTNGLVMSKFCITPSSKNVCWFT